MNYLNAYPGHIDHGMLGYAHKAHKYYETSPIYSPQDSLQVLHMKMIAWIGTRLIIRTACHDGTSIGR